MKQTKTLAIKARLANHIRKTLYKKHLHEVTNKEKVSIFNEIFGINLEVHCELNNYKRKRKEKRRIHEERVARGYRFKKKTSLADYQKINLEK